MFECVMLCFTIITFFVFSATYNIDPDSVTISGISSGAAFATQFHVAHSALVKGVGMFAGGQYC